MLFDIHQLVDAKIATRDANEISQYSLILRGRFRTAEMCKFFF